MSYGLASVIPSYRQALDPKVEARALERLAKDPQVQRKMKDFETAIGKAKDLDAALRDPRVLAVLLPSMGLGDQLDYPGLARRALAADPADPKGLLSRLTDIRWKDAVVALDLKKKGIEALRDLANLARFDKGLRSLQWRQSLDETTTGLSDALYFKQVAASVTSTYGLLGNAVLRRVVTRALGLPDELALQSVEAQSRAVAKRLPLADLRDPKKVERLIERYLTHANMDDAGQGSGYPLSLFA
ncbi:MAG: hypothetical protein JWO24_3890 [Rhodospirillales bacterium]|jgi:hypothetical protein|nr:hypothetical protein [Rhodospirillales bacterium]